MTMKEFGMCSGDNSVHSFGTVFCKYWYCWVLTVSMLILSIHLAFYIVSGLLHVTDCCCVNLQVFATLAVISYSTPIFISVIVPVGIIYYFIQV